MLTKNIRISILIPILCFFVSGCLSQQRVWKYSIDSYPTNRQPLLSKRVAVLPFRDLRPNKNENFLILHLLPLVPFGWVDYSTPEEPNGKLLSFPIWQFKPTEDLAKATADEINASGLFKEAVFTSSTSEGDLVLHGEIRSTRYKGRAISYGLFYYAPVGWVLGLPYGTIYNDLEVEFTLVDQLTGMSLWNKSYKMAYHKSPFWIYDIPPDFNYDNLFKAMMRDVVKDLESALLESSVR